MAEVQLELIRSEQAKEVLSESHVMNSHLNAMQVELALLTKQLTDAGVPATVFSQNNERIQAAITSLAAFVNDRQATALLQRNQLVLRPRTTDLTVLLSIATQRIAASYRGMNRRLTISIDGEMPLVYCDEARITQILYKLLENAHINASAFQSATVHVELSSTDKQVVCSITDDGQGIGPEDLAYLLEQIAYVSSSTAPLPETGFGLLSCARLIVLQNGVFEITSPGRGHGTTVTIRLPVAQQVLEQPLERPSEQALEQPLKNAPPPALTPLRILIVDDDAVVIRALPRLLERHGYQTRATSDGETAIRWYREQAFDLIISDAFMPGLGGLEFLQRLWEIDRDAQALVMTGQGPSNMVEEMVRAGAFEVINKPFTVDELLNAIARMPRRCITSPEVTQDQNAKSTDNSGH